MAAVTNLDVAKAFLRGAPAQSRNMWTDGQRLKSYGEVVAIRVVDGDRVVIDAVRQCKSATTSRHLSMVSTLADEVRRVAALPPAAK